MTKELIRSLVMTHHSMGGEAKKRLYQLYQKTMEVLDFAVFFTGNINISTIQTTFTCSKSKNLQLCLYTEIQVPEKIHILAYFTQ